MDQPAFNVIVRSPNQKFKDVNIQLNSDCTIQDLKRKIESDHPGSPKANQQKLIFNGRMLADHHRIDTVIKETDKVIHLVYSGDESKGENKQEMTASASTSQTPDLRHRFPPQPQVANTPYSLHDYSAYSQAYTEWLQQYHQQYMQYFAAQNPYFAMSSGVQSVASVAVNATNMANQPPAGAQEPEQVQNAEGGAAAAEDIGQDWLDVMFALTRFTFLLSIIYFYSTTYRFIIAVTLLLAIYLYQAGIFQVNRRQGRAQEANNPEPATDDNNNNDGESANEEQEEPNAPEPPSIFATAICFIRSFFSSLVPTGPPAVVN